LEENRELARLSKQLVTLQLDLDVGVDVAELGPPAPDPDKLRPLFQRLEFKNLLADLAAQSPPQDQVKQNYSVVDDAADLEALVGRLQACESFAIAAETTGATLHSRKLVGMAFAMAPGEAVYVPLGD